MDHLYGYSMTIGPDGKPRVREFDNVRCPFGGWGTTTCRFIVLGGNEEDSGGDKDWQDNQFSIRKIEEAAMRGIRSGMDKVYLLADNEEMAKSISGKIEWLASFGSLIRLDAISLGMFPTQQQESAVITPSQKRVPQGRKIRKQMIKEREAKIEKHSKPKGRKRQKASEIKKRVREALLNKHNRPKGQRKRKRKERWFSITV